MRLKVCGMRELENISALSELEPNYIGFIFWSESSRFVDKKTPPLDKKIIKTGVFVDATFDYNINPVSSDEVPLWIGNLTGSADDPEGGAFNGHIDEIGILDIALTGDEVRNIIANGFEINSNVAAYWDFSSGSGVQLVDQSSNANNGAIILIPEQDLSLIHI